MRSLLDHQADGIEYTLHAHGIEASVVGGNISPRLIQFHVKLENSVRFSQIMVLADELAVALKVAHVRITHDDYVVKIEVPRPDPVPVRLFPLMNDLPTDLPENAPILGLDEDGVPLLVRFASPDIAHILISGVSGSGKTILARSMIGSLALQNPPDRVKLLLIDPKGRGYRPYNGLPNLVCPVVTDAVDGLHRLKWAIRHLEKRLDNGVTLPALVIFIDELADLMAVNSRETELVINYLLQNGREVGIHLVACTQKPAMPLLQKVIMGDFPTRIVGRVTSAEDARIASGIRNSGAEKLMGKGDFLLFSQGETTRLQAAHISSAEMQQTVVHLGGIVEQQIARPERQPLEPVDDASYGRQFQRQQPDYEPEEDYGQRYNQTRQAASGGRQAKSYRESANYGKEAMGIAERLEGFERRIYEGRIPNASITNPDTQPTKSSPGYTPTRSEKANAQRVIKPEVADSEFEDDDNDDTPNNSTQKKTTSSRSAHPISSNKAQKMNNRFKEIHPKETTPKEDEQSEDAKKLRSEKHDNSKGLNKNDGSVLMSHITQKLKVSLSRT